MKSRAARPDTAHVMPWWCSPAGISLGFLLPLMFLIAFAGQGASPAMTIRGVRFLDWHYLMLGGSMILVIALGGWFGAQLHARAPSRALTAGEEAARQRGWDRAAFGLGWIALLAFLIWFRDFLLNPPLLLRILTGAYTPDRNDITLTPGLTSLANFTPAFFSIYAMRAFGGQSTRPTRALHALAITLVLLTLFRVYAWSERLALIESAIPFGLVLGRRMSDWRSPAGTLARGVGPYGAIPFLIAFFGLAEYARSWSAGNYKGQFSFWEFAIGRFASYYYTSLNNGAGLLATSRWPTFRFEYTLEWLHSAPFGLGKPFSQAVGYEGSGFHDYLSTYEDVEFNSPSGVFAVISDLGITGAVAYTFCMACAAGLAYRAYREGRLTGVLLYPMFFVTFMEIYRYAYLSQPRAFTWVLGMGLALALARTGGATARTLKPQGA